MSDRDECECAWICGCLGADDGSDDGGDTRTRDADWAAEDRGAAVRLRLWPPATPTPVTLDQHPEATIRRLAEELRDERQRADHAAAQCETAMRELDRAIEQCGREQQRADRLAAELDQIVSPIPERFPPAGPPLEPESLAHQLDAARRHTAALEDRLARHEGRPVRTRRRPELQAIRNRVRWTAPGPWQVVDPNQDSGHAPMWMVVNNAYLNPAESEGMPVRIVIEVGDEDDAEFIARAPDDMRMLLDEVDRLTLAVSRRQACGGAS